MDRRWIASLNRSDELNQRIQTPKDPKTTTQGLLKPLLGALGPSLEGLGGLLGRLEGVLGCSWALLGSFGKVVAAHEAINGSFWNAIR